MAVKFTEVVDAETKGTTTVVIGEDGKKYKLKGTASARNNNPGAIKYGPNARKFGAIGQTKPPPGSTDGLGYAIFPTFEAGLAAQEHILFGDDRFANMTIANRFSGKSGTGSYATDEAIGAYPNYARDIAAAAGVPLDTKMSDLTPAQRRAVLGVIHGVEGYESGIGKLRIVGEDGTVLQFSQVIGNDPLPPENVGKEAGSISAGAVSTIQQTLKSQGFDPGPIDGIRGPQTTAAVKAFQKANGLTVDGIVGPQTRAALEKAAATPSGRTSDFAELSGTTAPPVPYKMPPGVAAQRAATIGGGAVTVSPGVGTAAPVTGETPPTGKIAPIPLQRRPPANITGPVPPPRRPDQPATPAAPTKQIATTVNGKQVEVGKTYEIGGNSYVAGVDENGVGTLKKVEKSFLEKEATANTVAGAAIREKIAEETAKQVSAPRPTIQPLLKDAGKVLEGAAGSVTSFFGDIFKGPQPTIEKKSPVSGGPSIEARDERAAAVQAGGAAAVTAIPGVPTAAMLSRSVKVPKTVQVLNPAYVEWEKKYGDGSQVQTAATGGLITRDQFAAMSAVGPNAYALPKPDSLIPAPPRYIEEQVMVDRTIKVPAATPTATTRQPATVATPKGETVVARIRRETGASAASAYDTANRQSAERAIANSSMSAESKARALRNL